MPRLSPITLNLRDSDRHELQQLIDQPNIPQYIALRAKIILMASDGQSIYKILRKLGVHKQTIRHWRNRWLETEGEELSVFQRLEDWRSVSKSVKFSMEQAIKLYTIICSPPEDYGRPISKWTPKKLADEIMKQGIVESISVEQAKKFLKKFRKAQLKLH